MQISASCNESGSMDNFVDIIEFRAKTQPDDVAYTFLNDSDNPIELTWKELSEKAKSIAVQLLKHADPGSRALILLPQGLEYLTSYFGCLYAGIYAVPAYPPGQWRQLPRIQAISDAAEASIAITSVTNYKRVLKMQDKLARLADLSWVVVEEIDNQPYDEWQYPNIDRNSIAFLQYTSGSTSTPKGVMVSHGNLIDNIHYFSNSYGHTAENTVGVFWIPLFHDMGLIAGALAGPVIGYHTVLMPPVTFMVNPFRWLWAIDHYGGTFTSAPNFAFDLCAQKISDEQKEKLNLSSLKTIMNAAEPVRAETLERFAEAFKCCGYNPNAMHPSYGLAEATLIISANKEDTTAKFLPIDKDDFGNGLISVIDEKDPNAFRAVSNGKIFGDEHHCTIVNPETLEECKPNEIGEIWHTGPSIAQGYFMLPQVSEDTFRARISNSSDKRPYLRTGDLGFMVDGELYVSGRAKDLVIIHGRNFYPQDIEFTIESSHSDLRVTGSAVFSDNIDGEEWMVVVQELDYRKKPDHTEVIDSILKSLGDTHDLIQISTVVLIKPGTIPKTSSGKIQRNRCREQYKSGELQVVFEWNNPSTNSTLEEPTERAPYEEPSTEQEKAIAEQWQTILGVEQVGLNDHFFNLGGHSLLATSLITAVQLAFGKDINIRTLFENPTLKSFSTAVEKANILDKPNTIPLEYSPNSQENYPLSFAQNRLWFFTQLEPNSPFYNISALIHLRGEIDIQTLHKSIQDIIIRHQSLRTSFQQLGDSPRQLVHEQPAFEFPFIDLSNLPATEKDETLNSFIKAEGLIPFDLTIPPLFRLKLIKIRDKKFRILFTIHHIIADGWSMGVFVRELAHLYHAYINNTEPKLEKLLIQYPDFAEWQRNHFTDEILEQQIGFWKKELDGASFFLDLPTDHPRPAQQKHNGGIHSFVIDANLHQSINDFCKTKSCTPFMFLMTVFQTFLYRYSGQNDFCVGTPFANRTQQEIQDLIGFFVNSLVFRARFDDDPDIDTLLKRTQEMATGAFSNNDVPFERLVEVLQPERNLSHSPIFQTMFVLQTTPFSKLETDGLSISWSEAELGTAKLDLTLVIQEQDGVLQAAFDYSLDLFEPRTIETMAEQFVCLLKSFTIRQNFKVAELQILPKYQRDFLLNEWNNTDIEYEQNLCFHNLFEQQARNNPNHIAVVFQDQILTYAALNEKANQLAHHLIEKGVRPEDVVAICLNRSLEMVVAMLGVLKSGAAYVPLDPAYPPVRLSFMLGKSQSTALITKEDMLKQFPTFSKTVVVIDSQKDELKSLSSCNPDVDITPDNLAYIIFTSGSTGTPKGVTVTHRGFSNLKAVQQKLLDLDEKSRVLQFASFSFDSSVWEFAVLSAGGRLYLDERERLQSPPELLTLLRDERITIATLPPALLQILPNSDDLSLDVVISAGEKCPADVVANWSKNRRFYNGYGPTENTVCATMHMCHGATENPPIGKPTPNSKAYLLDKSMNLVPAGVPGELYVTGVGQARGYLDQPDLTAERFVPNPFSASGGGRLYKTGDIARLNSDLELEFIGRIDFQVQIRGHRVELSGIEAHIMEYDGVKSVTVQVNSDRLGNNQIIAYIVPDKPEEFSTSNLRLFLADHLPDYMMPAAFVVIDSIPLTPNGKVDKKKLPSVDLELSKSDNYVPARNGTESLLVQIWEDLLKRQHICVFDNFFEIGGHSLMATQMVSIIGDTMLVELPLKIIFESPTIADIATYLNQCQKTVSKLPPITKFDRSERCQLSYGQQRLWFMDRFTPGDNSYNIPFAISLNGALNPEILEKAISTIIDRHEILRTSFINIDGKPGQIVSDLEPFTLETSELENNQDRINEALLRKSQTCFDLSAGKLMNIKLYKHNENSFTLAIVKHHIISDGWSCSIFLREISAVYNAILKRIDPPLQPLSVQYIDYANWQRSYVESEVIQKQISYWKNKLTEIPQKLELPTDYPRPNTQSHVGDRVCFEINEELTSALHQVSRKSGSTLYMTLLTAYAILLYRFSGQKTFCIGSPVAGRTAPETQNLIGLFINTLAIRCDFSDNTTFSKLLNDFKSTILEAFANQNVPFEKVVDAVNPERDTSHSPIFQVFFGLQNAPEPRLDLIDIESKVFEIEAPISKFDLMLDMSEDGSVLSGQFKFATALFRQETIELLLTNYLSILNRIADTPVQSLSQIFQPPSWQKLCLVKHWNQTDQAVALDRPFNILFEERAARHPDRDALIAQDATLTYSELNKRANQLAHLIKDKDLPENSPIAICLDRNSDLLIALLAIIKSGHYYLPIDPEYPQSRIKYLLEDSGTNLLITHKKVCNEMIGGFKESISIINIDENRNTISKNLDTNLDISVYPESSMYLIYTSGSTGRPKGTRVSHANVVHLFHALDSTVYAGAPEPYIVTMNASIAFDAVVKQYIQLLGGHTLCLVTEEQRNDPEAFVNLINDTKVDVLDCTPRQLQLLFDHGSFPKLSKVLIGGEAIDDGLWNILTNDESTEYINVYGPTECTVDATIHPISPIDEKPSIGQPIPNVKVYVLDNEMNLLPIGVPGELYIGGLGVSQGYHNRPDLTAEKFIPDPFSIIEGARLYRTGDCVRFDLEGKLEYIGRTDNQVKIRGYRIELEEIESLLSEHKDVISCCVLAKNDQNNQKRLVGYIATRKGEKFSSELRKYLEETLPDYMIPSVFVCLPQLPLNQHGKIDKDKLPEPSMKDLVSSGYVEARNDTEQQLVEIWQNILNLPKIGIHDNFFELGGDSILSIQIVSKARQSGLQLSPKALFQKQTIAELSEIVSSQKPASDNLNNYKTITGDITLTPIMKRFFDIKHDDIHHWNQSLLFRTNREISFNVLDRIGNHLIQHHDVMRLKFVNINNEWIGSHEGSYQAAFSEEIESENEIASVISKHQTEINIKQGPLLRLILIDCKKSNQQWVLMIAHHLVVDGVSWRIILEDIEQLLGQIESDKPLILPGKTDSFQNWGKSLATITSSDIIRSDIEYWQRQANLSRKSLPINSVENNCEGDVVTTSIKFSKDQTQVILQDLPKSLHLRAHETLISALSLALSKFSNHATVAIETEGHGREDIIEGFDHSRTVGWFTSVYPLIISLSENSNITDQIKAVKQQLTEVPNNGFSYGLLRYSDLPVASDLQSLDDIEVSFNYLGQFELGNNSESSLSLEAIQPETDRSAKTQRSHALTFLGLVQNQSLEIMLSYNPKQLDSSIANEILNSINEYIEKIISCSTEDVKNTLVATDFPIANLDQTVFEKIIDTYPDLTDIYPLTPIQEGFLYHDTLSRGDSANYFEQMHCLLSGNIDPEKFFNAWHELSSRHPILRTAFVYQDLPKPLQIVLNECPIETILEDWSSVNETEQQQRLEEFLKRDIERSFDLTNPPLMRVALLKKSEDSYFMAWSHHHIVLDGWSISLVLKDLFDTYALESGESVELSTPVPYFNFIQWLNQQPKSSGKQFWQQYLQGISQSTTLPEGFANKGETGFGKCKTMLSEDTTKRVEEFVRSHRLTLNSVLQACWATTLHKNNSEKDIIFGATVSGRPADLNQAGEIVGPLINTLPIRVSIQPKSTLVEWIRQIQLNMVYVSEYDYCHLVDIQSWSDIPREQDLFETLFVFENFPIDMSLLEGNKYFSMKDISVSEQTHFPLMVTMVPGDQLSLKVDFDRNRFSESVANEILEQFAELLERITTFDESVLVTDLLSLSKQENEKLQSFNNDKQDYPEKTAVHNLFESQVKLTPDATAIVCLEQSITYSELDKRANQLANYLLEKGTPADSIIGICMNRSIEMVVSVLAVLKAGCGYAALDPNYPEDRLAYMINDAKAPFIITQKGIMNNMPVTEDHIICLNNESENIGNHPTTKPNIEITADNLAYVIYTSGSTGRPKGVAMNHGPVTNLMQWQQRNTKINPAAKTVAYASLSFDVSHQEIFFTLGSGGTLLFTSDEQRLDTAALTRLIDENKAERLFAPFVILQHLAQEYQQQSNYPVHLREIITAGEQLQITPPIRNFFNNLPECTLHNQYGPSETHVATALTLDGSSEDWPLLPSIGKPVTNSSIYLLNEDLNPVPIGATGELYIGQIAGRGYHRRPDLTAEKFLPDPFTEINGARMYATGDLARWLPDGNIEFQGRIDFQVKIRGFRIELGELESLLAQHPQIKECAVDARTSASGQKQLVAYIIVEGNSEVQAQTNDSSFKNDIRDFISQSVPDYMVPSVFIMLNQLPISPNGKVDRKALPDPDEKISFESEYIEPTTDDEKAMCEIWQSVLQVERVGITDHFFDLGGNSILAMQLISKIRSYFNKDLPLRSLLETGTIKEVIKILNEIEASEKEPASRPKIKKRDRRPRPSRG